ncbi:MAG: helix-turn-helix domain-containing protein, partial [Candidatus Kerfeldbacteria bacterium]|nr:helix-turn-helix domain-containing protein [Candidatus Kerfeldbacteria bacterium]
MMFRQRPIAAPDTLGERLRQLREEAHLSLDEIGREIHVASKYLSAIEEGRYQELPGPVYARNFVRLYIQRMGLSLDAAMETFAAEYTIMTAARPAKRPMLAQRSKHRTPWWRQHRRLVLAAALILVVIGYFGWQVARLISPPLLVVTQPASDRSQKATFITVVGQTEIGAKVAINNQAVDTAANGTFSVRIDLQPGLNTLEISA